MMLTSMFNGFHVPRCTAIPAIEITWYERMPWIFVIIAVVSAAAIMGRLW